MDKAVRDQVVDAACQELLEEDFRQAVDALKTRIKARQGRPWWVRFFPYRLKWEKL